MVGDPLLPALRDPETEEFARDRGLVGPLTLVSTTDPRAWRRVKRMHRTGLVSVRRHCGCILPPGPESPSPDGTRREYEAHGAFHKYKQVDDS